MAFILVMPLLTTTSSRCNAAEDVLVFNPLPIFDFAACVAAAGGTRRNTVVGVAGPFIFGCRNTVEIIALIFTIALLIMKA